MTELQAILKTWRSLKTEQRDAVLATVVHVAGSAYRRPGARLLLAPDGRRIGSVSGGCLEGEIARKAWSWTESKQACLQVFDTTSEDDAIWGFGLGCNGVVQVLMERASSPGTAQLLEFLEMTQALREPAVVATVVRPAAKSGLRPGERLLVERGNVKGELAAHDQAQALAACADVVLRSRRSEFVHSDCADIFMEYIPPSPSLVILGAGYDAQPLVTIAKEVGFRVTVADARSAYLKRGRFPDADTVVLLSDDHATRDILVGPDTAVVLMTHNYQLDARLLPSVLAAGPRYLGLLGPRTRAERLFEDLRMAMPEYVNAPVGLDIGGDTPMAVALSIVAEIQAVLEGRCGSMLKRRRSAIHSSNMEWWLLCTPDGRLIHPSDCDSQVETMFNVGIILLAAGNSSRMGSAKQLMNVKGKPLLRHAAEVACRCDCAPVIVVVGSREQDMRPTLKELPLEVTTNDSWLGGIGTSIKAGLHALGNRPLSGVILALADQPFIGPCALRRIAEQQDRSQKRIVASRYSETVGPPAFFSRELFPKLLALEPHQGCKAILLDSLKDALLIDCPEGAIDIDTPMDYATLR